jgi:hypothetical protein
MHSQTMVFGGKSFAKFEPENMISIYAKDFSWKKFTKIQRIK